MVTSGIVIDRITRVGDIGEPGYSVYGQELRHCSYKGRKDYWHGATQDALSSVLPTCYITESVYSYLTNGEIASVRSRILGIVPNEYAHIVYGGIDSFNKSYRCWEFLPGIEAIPLPSDDDEIDDGTISDDITDDETEYDNELPNGTIVCFYGDILAKIGGYNGIDHLIVDRSDGGPNIWSSNFTVGSCTHDGDDDEEYPLKSQVATDLSSIFGDIKPVHIIIAVLAMIFLGLLS